jgi:hypothetical protein
MTSVPLVVISVPRFLDRHPWEQMGVFRIRGRRAGTSERNTIALTAGATTEPRSNPSAHPDAD